MAPPTIRPARTDEYDEVARIWMNSWVSTGLEAASNFLLAKLRARVPLEVLSDTMQPFPSFSGIYDAALIALRMQIADMPPPTRPRDAQMANLTG